MAGKEKNFKAKQTKKPPETKMCIEEYQCASTWDHSKIFLAYLKIIFFLNDIKFSFNSFTLWGQCHVVKCVINKKTASQKCIFSCK